MTVCPMAERNVGRPWTEEEDKLLTEAVAKHGEHDNWKTISLSVPDRTNKACRKRWLHSLSPNVKKTAWTPEEDKLLLELYDKFGSKWSTIARDILGRTDDACSKRYREALDPSLKKDEWTPDEDRRLLEAYARLGGKWGQVGHEFGRSGLGCRNRWRLLERKKSKTTRATPSSSTLHLLDLPGSQASSSQPLHLELPQEDPNILRYCPPEAYTGFPTEEPPGLEHSFREPTPPEVRPLHAQLSSFQVSSTSSLSAALSDPPSLHQPLPPVVNFHNDRSNSEPLPSLAPSPLFYGTSEMSQDDHMSLDELPEVNEAFLSHYALPQYFPHSYTANIREPGMHSSISPISYPSDIGLPGDLGNNIHGPWKSPNPFEELYMILEHASVDRGLSVSDTHDTPSSASSTPFHILSPLSATSSPSAYLPQELPIYEQSASGSLLFSDNRASTSNVASPSQHVLALQQEPHDPNVHRTGPIFEQPNPAHQAPPPITQTVRHVSTSTRATPSPLRRPRKVVSKKTPKMPIVRPGSRLSSALTLSDPSLKPYACGRERCWPADALTSVSCFATSKELLDHTKEEHPHDIPGDKPYRCSLTGCGKSWKSVNGLQYHLQISTVHFKHAISSTKFSSAKPSTSDDQTPAGSGTETDGEDPERVFQCHHPNCAKAYRQPSGLRYHLKHGHPQDMPAQLPMVPPALARHISTKVKKKRKEPSPSESGD